MSDEKSKTKKKKIDEEIDESQDSHEYDGIKELNNPAPYWIMAIFIVTIGFAMVYTIHNFGYPGNEMDQTTRYDKSIAKFEEETRRKLAEASGVEYTLSQEQILEAGASLYLAKGCIACHGSAGEGNNIGPNLTDNFWINGCSSEEILEIIKEGKPEKGMTPYKSMMTEEQMIHLTSYIKLSLVGSDPQNAKAPQGEECNE
jgi:cytochrome c oxidase cbb3-type subunit 3